MPITVCMQLDVTVQKNYSERLSHYQKMANRQVLLECFKSVDIGLLFHSEDMDDPFQCCSEDTARDHVTGTAQSIVNKIL